MAIAERIEKLYGSIPGISDPWLTTLVWENDTRTAMTIGGPMAGPGSIVWQSGDGSLLDSLRILRDIIASPAYAMPRHPLPVGRWCGVALANQSEPAGGTVVRFVRVVTREDGLLSMTRTYPSGYKMDDFPPDNEPINLMLINIVAAIARTGEPL